MKSIFGKNISRENPRDDHPNPQFARSSFVSLNGPWDFKIDFEAKTPSEYDSKIIVPFAPETELSEINRSIEKGEYLHYRRRFLRPEGFSKGKTLIHFEAVDQIADVYLNGVYLGHHEGGYLPFAFEVDDLKEENELVVDVFDDPDSDVYPRGKQMRNPSGIWYTPTSGIWGCVWLERVPEEYIEKLHIEPDFDKKTLKLQVFFKGNVQKGLVKILYQDKVVASKDVDEKLDLEIDLSSDFHPWSPEDPALYSLVARVNEDEVSSYFAMRKFSVGEKNGKKVFELNNKPYFLNGVLDQGYWPESGLTPPSMEAMEFDIKAMKELGFNMLRKHIKVEPMPWYSLCDRLGMIVIQDVINAGTPYKQFLINTCPFIRWPFNDTKPKTQAYIGRGNKASRDYFEDEMPKFVEHFQNVPCICAWTLFNEGWGQFDAVRLTKKLRELDPTRLIDSTSGWFDQGVGDFNSRHIYFRAPKARSDGKRILFISEFGGYVSQIEGHSLSSKGVHYFKSKDLTQEYVKTFEKTLLPRIEKEGLCATVYTQLCDVEGEANGLYTYDREICKVDKERIRAINEKMRFEK